MNTITITITEPITPYTAEKLEEEIRKVIRARRVSAVIEDSITGNTINTEIIRKEE